jgi:hypothetical protein
MLNPKTYLWKWGFEPPKMCRFSHGYFFYLNKQKKKGARENEEINILNLLILELGIWNCLTLWMIRDKIFSF